MSIFDNLFPNPSKGIDYFVYLSGQPFQVKVSSRGSSDRLFTCDSNQLVGEIQKGHCEISMSDINLTEHTGRFQIDAVKTDAIYLSKYAEIAPSNGNLGDSNLNDMLQTPSIVKEDFAVSYGFYDAGTNESHQAYMYVTDNYSNWMGNLIDEKPELKNKSFGTFVLPGSHDAGMFTGIDSEEEARYSIDRLADNIPGAALLKEATNSAKRAIINFAYTQKDNIETQLKLGVRYFDFRPGYNVNSYRKDDILRHQHTVIPGYEFQSFLLDVVNFLKIHSQEIVVVNLKYSGFVADYMKPDENIVNSYILNSLEGSNINQGNINDLTKTVEDLLNSNQRLIFLYGSSRDSYTENLYKTNDVTKIIDALKATLNEREQDWTVLQLQGTFNGTLEGGNKSLLTFSDASSPLLSTKAKFDCTTYDWVSKKENVASKCGNNLLVLLNDFVDNALVSHSIAITKQRLNIN